MLDNLRHLDWEHRDIEAQMSSLWVVPHEAWYSAQRAWRGDGTRLGWYVNFQEPLRQASNAIRTMDLALDLVVDADGPNSSKIGATSTSSARTGSSPTR
jgi:protein associated with RNAse G/E